METIFTNNNFKVQASIKTNKFGTYACLYVNDRRTDARIYTDEDLETATFNVTSSSPIRDQATAEKVATAVMDYLAR